MGCYSPLKILLEVKMPITGTSVAAYELVDLIQRLLFFLFLFPYYPLSSCQVFLPLISALTGFHDWGGYQMGSTTDHL